MPTLFSPMTVVIASRYWYLCALPGFPVIASQFPCYAKIVPC